MTSPSSSPVDLQHVAIAGAGLAGARTAFSLRKLGFTGKLTILNAEDHSPYDRPPLSKELFTRTGPLLLAEDQGVDISALADQVLDSTELSAITGANPQAGNSSPLNLTVSQAEAGTQNLAVDAVVLATGSLPIRPATWQGGRTLRTIDDALALRSALQAGDHLVIVGAGWIGAEVAAAARAAGMRVSILEADEQPFSRALPAEITVHLVPWFAAAGVDLHLSSPVAAVLDQGSQQAVQLVSGAGIESEIAADQVLLAIGVRGNSAPYWPAPATRSGLIPVDSELRPTAAGNLPAERIRVVGDVAGRQHPNYPHVPTGHWDFALHDGELAAASLLRAFTPAAHARPSLPAIRPPYVFSEMFGRSVALLGVPSPGDLLEFTGDPTVTEQWAAHWYAPGSGQLRAVFTVNDPRALSAARRKLRNQ